jgi:hypothetical protein
LKGERGHEPFKNLLRGERIRLISLFWKNKLLKDGNGRWVGCGLFFIKALIVDGREGPGLYFFIFFIFMFVIFFTFKGRKGGQGFKVKKYNLYLLDCKRHETSSPFVYKELA